MARSLSFVEGWDEAFELILIILPNLVASLRKTVFTQRRKGKTRKARKGMFQYIFVLCTLYPVLNTQHLSRVYRDSTLHIGIFIKPYLLPCTLYSVPFTLYPTLNIYPEFIGTQHSILAFSSSPIYYLVLCTLYPVPNIYPEFIGTQHSSLAFSSSPFYYLVLCTLYPIPCTLYPTFHQAHFIPPFWNAYSLKTPPSTPTLCL